MQKKSTTTSCRHCSWKNPAIWLAGNKETNCLKPSPLCINAQIFNSTPITPIIQARRTSKDISYLEKPEQVWTYQPKIGMWFVFFVCGCLSAYKQNDPWVSAISVLRVIIWEADIPEKIASITSQLLWPSMCEKSAKQRTTFDKDW